MSHYIPQKHPLRNAVASLSSEGVGTYYSQLHYWWGRVQHTLKEGGFPLERREDDPPIVYGVEGRWILPLGGTNTRLCVYVYRMPSGNYEVVNYLT
jgi:hypothetical protein